MKPCILCMAETRNGVKKKKTDKTISEFILFQIQHCEINQSRDSCKVERNNNYKGKELYVAEFLVVCILLRMPECEVVHPEPERI